MATHSSVLVWKIPWTEEPGRPQSMGLPRQEYWSSLPFPSPGDLPDPRIKPTSPALQTDALTAEPPGKPIPKLEKSPYSNKDPKINNFLNLVKINKYKRTESRTSLAVQWVKFCASNAGRMGSITGQGKIPNAGRCSQKNPSPASKELMRGSGCNISRLVTRRVLLAQCASWAGVPTLSGPQGIPLKLGVGVCSVRTHLPMSRSFL